ncbi:uncharacterized protein MONOS_8354 [Monocercomonoides exilis]|uniref:uncharacterized protein n=1 Tax=Monocercomonoides exilis TaxID=2049356 RepID=UPI00355A7D3B|nr:hypothetical protein MONOS_8354 [Monocercomonoides exilis]|eukprot:MONOS_8354.1-p1 / transcript=MONOS_8354.1 / gene=MONOS_8354 / organism=Monocercomonoides_exilis_PA203 / gene_product=unspecified product / transcript_product=unspecified product / location=Mono_scaffold00313:54174-54959(-) / protein_length=217 / sequence_SO=supercontig / SO=protein_coding / is_pseudo=false
MSLSHTPQPSPAESSVRPLRSLPLLQPSPQRKMERKKTTRTQLAQKAAEKTGSTRQKTQQPHLGGCFCVTKTSCLICHQSITRQSNAGTPLSSCGKHNAGLKKLFVRLTQQVGEKEGAVLLHSHGEALFHFFNQLGSPQLPKPTTIPSSHAGATGGILANDANSFLSLLCGTRLFSFGGEDTVRDAQMIMNMRKEMNVWRGERRAAVEGGDEARDS